jgi:hypothetical protein
MATIFLSGWAAKIASARALLSRGGGHAEQRGLLRLELCLGYHSCVSQMLQPFQLADEIVLVSHGETLPES